jgi:hypothetical protein
MDLAFNISNNQAVESWSGKEAAQVVGISGYSHMIIFVTMHLDPNRGNLWLGHDKHNEPCATTVSNVSAGLFYYSYINYQFNSGLKLFLGPLSPYLVAIHYIYWPAKWL